ncbi:MAG: hypothetical protein Q9177_004120, partial [Variospora cf. flavescens]
MNHAPSDSISSIPSSSHHSSNHASPSHSSQDETAAGSPNEDPQHHVKKIRKRYQTQFLDHLIRQLDIMIYYQLSILYYM